MDRTFLLAGILEGKNYRQEVVRIVGRWCGDAFSRCPGARAKMKNKKKGLFTKFPVRLLLACRPPAWVVWLGGWSPKDLQFCTIFTSSLCAVTWKLRNLSYCEFPSWIAEFNLVISHPSLVILYFIPDKLDTREIRLQKITRYGNSIYTFLSFFILLLATCDNLSW